MDSWDFGFQISDFRLRMLNISLLSAVSNLKSAI